VLKARATVLRIQICVQFFGGGDGGMSVAENGISAAALADIFVGSSVEVEVEEIGSVVRALARINAAARVLLRPAFDETVEGYFRLLEEEGAGAGA
jgi:hypothetical protein